MSDPDKLVTAEQAAAAYKTTVGYIYKLASIHHWRRIRDGKTMYYHWDDVGKCLGK